MGYGSCDETHSDIANNSRKMSTRKSHIMLNKWLNLLLASGDIPGPNELFDKSTLFRVIIRELGRATACEMMFEEFTIE